MTRLFCTLAATVLLSVPALAQTLIEGGRLESPVLGRFWDPQAKAMRSVNGVPGASSASAPTGVEALRYAASAPHRNWAIVDRADAGSLETMTFGRTGATLRGFEAARGVDQIAFSPSGDAAILYWRGARAEVWKNFSTTPERAASYSLDGVEGDVRSLAVADDASVAALIVDAGDKAQLFSLTGSMNKVGTADGWSAVAFAPGTRVAFVANRETSEISQFSNFGSDSTSSVVASSTDGVVSPSAIAISSDGRKLVVANQDDPSVAVIELDTRRSTVLTLERAADGFYALEGNAVFRLSASPKPEIFLLDADGADARISAVAIPAAEIAQPTDSKATTVAAKGGK